MSHREFESSADVAHVWWFSGQMPRRGPLSDVEVARMGRFRRADDRRWFATRRTLLRQILAAYVGQSPPELIIDRTCDRCGDPDHGRPRLVDGPDLSFSTSGRRWFGMVAISSAENAVGVDVEVVDAAAAPAVARVSLTPEERASIADGVPGDLIRLWSRKEAVAKSTGGGLVGLDVADVDVRPDVAGGRHLRDIPAPAGCVAALATVHRVERLVVRTWPTEQVPTSPMFAVASGATVD